MNGLSKVWQSSVLVLRKLWMLRPSKVIARLVRQSRRFLALRRSVNTLLKTVVVPRGSFTQIWPHLTGKSGSMNYVGSFFDFRGVEHSFDKVPWFQSPDGNHSFPFRRMDEYSIQKFRFVGIDINYNWQLSRCAHFLVRGHRLDNPNLSDYEFFKMSVIDWTDANPFLFGVNWLCTMDVAIRAINLIVASNFFAEEIAGDDEFRDNLEVFLTQHAEYVHCFPEISDSGYNNNHASAGFTGLLFLALTLAGDQNASNWSNEAIIGLRQCMDFQTYQDGVNFEGSIPYHMLTLECFAFSLLLCRQQGIDLGDVFAKRILQMFIYADYVIDSQGRIPQIGDNDSARLLCFGSDVSRFDNILTLGEHLFKFKFKGKCRQRCELTSSLLPEVEKICPSELGLQEQEMLKLRVFEHGGIAVQSDRLFHAVICHHNLGQAGKGGHNHVDVGHFVLSFDGEQILGDPGSYSYNQSKRERDLFRHPTRHNMMLYQEECFDLTKSANFALPSFFDVQVVKRELNSEFTCLALEITSKNEKLTRRIHYQMSKEEFHITYSGDGNRTFENYFVFHPNCSIREQADVVVVNDKVEMAFSGHKSVSIDMIEYSLIYGVKTPAYRVVAVSEAKLEVRIKPLTPGA